MCGTRLGGVAYRCFEDQEPQPDLVPGTQLQREICWWSGNEIQTSENTRLILVEKDKPGIGVVTVEGRKGLPCSTEEFFSVECSAICVDIIFT